MSAALKVISAAIDLRVYLRAHRTTTLRAAAIYAALAIAYLAVMPSGRLWSHSPYNHYTLQADAWLSGRLSLPGPPPVYTGNNDFAVYQEAHYVSFPPVPAVLMLPFRLAAGQPERVRDPMIFALLAPLGPVLLFLALERLRASGRSPRTEDEHAWLAVLLGLGTVYWFSAVQGSVWFAGHVVTMVATCGFLVASVDARRPLLAGVLLALAFGTRPTAALFAPVFVYEALRSGRDRRALAKLGRFALGAAPIVLLLMWHNAARFDDPFEFGHRYLAIRWRGRIEEHGLFSFHYLRRNLSVFLGGLPFFTDRGLQINAHGLAIWFTTPIYAWALFPDRSTKRGWGLYLACAASAAAIALTVLTYQNTGWIQFGYRFSNDFAPLLFVMIALAGRRFSRPFWALAAFSVFVNGFGAATFDRPEHSHFYFIDPTQQILHAPPR
jgi:hypothetical protein